MDATAINSQSLNALIEGADYADAKGVAELLKSVGRVRIPFFFNNADYAGGLKQRVVSPIKGDIVKLSTVCQILTAGAGALTVNLKGGTAVTGLSQTIADATAVGTSQVTRVMEGATNAAVGVDDVIEICVDATPTAGGLNGYVEIQPN